jgi:hypothetical protein
MIDNFNIVCKVVEEKLGETLERISVKYVKKCYDLFESHFKFLIDVLQRSDAKKTSASDANDHF